MASCFFPSLLSWSACLTKSSQVGRNSFVYSTLYPSWMPFLISVSKIGAKSSYLPSWTESHSCQLSSIRVAEEGFLQGYKLRSQGNFHFLFHRASMDSRWGYFCSNLSPRIQREPVRGSVIPSFFCDSLLFCCFERL